MTYLVKSQIRHNGVTYTEDSVFPEKEEDVNYERLIELGVLREIVSPKQPEPAMESPVVEEPVAKKPAAKTTAAKTTV